MKNIQMVDLIGQYRNAKDEIDEAVLNCIASAQFINGPAVRSFQENFAEYLGAKFVIPCANGTDALQIALMALDLKPGDEVIVPAFTYVATAEVIALLGLKPVMVDVSPGTFNISGDLIRAAVTPRTRVVVPVHLFGQSCPMESILNIAREFDLYVIEDNAQATGAEYLFSDGTKKKTGTMGHIGCTSFFPSKNLGCFGDGGAICTDSDELAHKMRMIANHGQAKKYYHSVVGVNSRLDTIQAAILDVKLTRLNDYCAARGQVAEKYDAAFSKVDGLQVPEREQASTHVFHQYTLVVKNDLRDDLKANLQERGVPSMIYYPLPLYRQDAFKEYSEPGFSLPVTESLCDSVLSLPIHTEMDGETQNYIIEQAKAFFDERDSSL